MNRKAQSAMEYLITYGWAILVVAVVLGALFSLGVFNPLTFAPRANPGSCQVFRPYGAGTSTDINLAGVCNNELPKFVSILEASGQHVYYAINSLPLLSSGNVPWSATLWLYDPSIYATGPDCIAFSYGWSSWGDIPEYDGFALEADHAGTYYIKTSGGAIGVGPVFQSKWMFLAATYNGLYINGYDYSSNSMNYVSVLQSSTLVPALEAFIGWDGHHNDLCSASIANVQIYNASLSPSTVNSIYYEGIGGAPINLQNLVAWWPLNGDSQDYSGNGYQASASAGPFYTSGWSSAYTPP